MLCYRPVVTLEFWLLRDCWWWCDVQMGKHRVQSLFHVAKLICNDV